MVLFVKIIIVVLKIQHISEVEMFEWPMICLIMPYCTRNLPLLNMPQYNEGQNSIQLFRFWDEAVKKVQP